MIYARRNLNDAPAWIRKQAPKDAWLPQDGKFSYVGVYDLIRTLEPSWAKTPVDQLFDMVHKYSDEHPETAIGKWYRAASDRRWAHSDGM